MSAQESTRDYVASSEPTQNQKFYRRATHDEWRTPLSTSDPRSSMESDPRANGHLKTNTKEGKDFDPVFMMPGSLISSDDAQIPVQDKHSIVTRPSPTISQPIRFRSKRSSVSRYDSLQTVANKTESYTTPSQDLPKATGDHVSNRQSYTGESVLTALSSNPTGGQSPHELTAPGAINESIHPADSNLSPPLNSENEPQTSILEFNDRAAVAKSVTRADAHKDDSFQEPEKYESDNDELPPITTRYMRMLLELDNIPHTHNLAAPFFTWILLAGFVLFPGTFASLRIPDNINDSDVTNQVVKALLEAIKHLSHVALFVIAFICCGIGAAGMCYLWWRWNWNCVWLVNKIFLPGLMNSLAGLISTISSVYGAQHGRFTLTSKVTLTVTGASMIICGLLTMYYLLWELRNVKLEHHKLVGNQNMGERGERIMERIKKGANERVGPVGSFFSLV